MTEHIGTVRLVAKALSALMLVVLVIALIDVWRRRAMPLISYGGLELSASRMRQYRGEHLVEEEVVEGALIPWALISALFAYLVLVVRWNPESRWALRALHGRRRGRDDAQS